MHLSRFMKALLLTLMVGACGRVMAIPAPPTQLTVVRGTGLSNYVILNWSGGGGTFNVYRGTSYPVNLASPHATNVSQGYQDPLGADRMYLYVVTESDLSGESGASNTAGYTQIPGWTGPAPNVTPFGLAFRTWAGNGTQFGIPSQLPSSIFENQLRCGTPAIADRITSQGNGQFAFRNAACTTWLGTLQTSGGMLQGDAFWFSILNDASPITIILCGEADLNGSVSRLISAPTVPGTIRATPYSWRDPRVLQRNQLELLSNGNAFTGGVDMATSDKVVSQGPECVGCYFWYNTNTSTFEGTLMQVLPGQAYIIENNHVGNDWTYTYQFTGQP